MLADFQQGESKPQVHTIREVMPVKKDGDFIFPLKESYEKSRNTISAPNTSDEGVGRQGDDPQEVQEKDFPNASTSKEESDKLNDMSPIPIEDSGPKEGGEDNKQLQKRGRHPKVRDTRRKGRTKVYQRYSR